MAACPKIPTFPGSCASGRARPSGSEIWRCWGAFSASLCTIYALARNKSRPWITILKAALIKQPEVGYDRVPRHFSPRARRHHSSRRNHYALHPQRTREPLVRRSHLCLLPHHRLGVLVAVYVLAGSSSGWGTDSAVLASVVRAGLHSINGRHVYPLGPRHANYRRRPALERCDPALHQERR